MKHNKHQNQNKKMVSIQNQKKNLKQGQFSFKTIIKKNKSTTTNILTNGV